MATRKALFLMLFLDVAESIPNAEWCRRLRVRRGRLAAGEGWPVEPRAHRKWW
jgi:hypothetical protein